MYMKSYEFLIVYHPNWADLCSNTKAPESFVDNIFEPMKKLYLQFAKKKKKKKKKNRKLEFHAPENN